MHKEIEYLTINASYIISWPKDSDYAALSQEKLNDLGRMGWQLITTHHSERSGTTFIFSREL